MYSVWVEDRKNKNGKVHVVRWEITINGDRVRGFEHCGPSADFAEERAKEIRESLYTGRPIEKRIEIIPCEVFAERYKNNVRTTKSEGTSRNFDGRSIDLFVSWWKKPLSMFSRKDLHAYRDFLVEKGWKNATVHIKLRNLRTALNWAKDNKYIHESPFNGIKEKDLFPPLDDVGRYLTDPEIKSLLTAMPLRQAKAFYFILQTGLRHDELLRLDWKMIHRPVNSFWTMEITRSSHYGLGKKKTKTRASWRIVEINPNAAAVLGKPQDQGKVFPWKTQAGLMRPLREAAERLKMGRVRVHDGRHTAATNFMYRTGNYRELMYRFGWASMTSADVYLHVRKREEPVELFPFPHYFPTNSRFRAA